MLVKIEARILIFPGTDFHFPSTSVPPGTFFRLCRRPIKLCCKVHMHFLLVHKRYTVSRKNKPFSVYFILFIFPVSCLSSFFIVCMLWIKILSSFYLVLNGIRMLLWIPKSAESMQAYLTICLQIIIDVYSTEPLLEVAPAALETL